MLLQNWQRGTTSRRRSFLPGCRLFTVEQEGSLGATSLSLHTSPSAKGRLSAIHRSYTAPPPPQCILARSFKGPFCPSKGFPIELCIFQLLFAAQHCTATSTTAELFRINAELFRNRQEVQEGFYHYRITWISAPPSYSHQTPGLSLTAL